MKAFIQFLKKEFYHIFRDPRSLMILFAMPLVQLLLFGTVIKTEINDAEIAIWDKSRDISTQKLTNKILSSGYFKLAKIIQSEPEIDTEFRKGKIKLIIVFDYNFDKRLTNEGKASVQIIADASDPNNATILVNYVESIINDFLRVKNDMNIGLQPQMRMFYNEEMKSVYMFVPGLMAIILMLISAMMTSISLTKESELGSMEILLVSPLRPAQIILGKVLPYALLAFLDAIVIIRMGKNIFGVPIIGSRLLLFLETLFFIITALSLGIFISTITNSQLVAMMISAVALILPTILLSGFIFPIDNMPWILQFLSNIVPAKWFLIAIKNIMLKGLGLVVIWKETLVLLIMTVVLLVASIRRFKIRLE
ncbi:MAG: ABC transporter permease [Candidatus Marinimicrobia bacterium]|nr:ABC transporter permease [Candidatus Neomarinimicrobiota bacterium]